MVRLEGERIGRCWDVAGHLDRTLHDLVIFAAGLAALRMGLSIMLGLNAHD